jgi:pimeloyl-ACP methyl ester carboxylesterase
MLLVHGYSLSGALFIRVLDRLREDHTVITPDLRGFGRSHAPSVTDSVDVYAEDMLALLDSLCIEKAIIGGMSMGGPTVVSMYAKAPDRFAGLVLIDTNLMMPTPAEAEEWRGIAAMAEKTGTKDIIPFFIPQVLTGKTRAEHKAQVEYITEIIKPCSKAGLLSGAKALGTRADFTELLGTVVVPTLLVVGQEDPIYPVEVSQAMAQKIDNARLHVVPGGSHAAIFEVPHDAGGAIANWAASVSKVN